MPGTSVGAGDSLVSLGEDSIEHINRHECIIPNSDYSKKKIAGVMKHITKSNGTRVKLRILNVIILTMG